MGMQCRAIDLGVDLACRQARKHVETKLSADTWHAADVIAFSVRFWTNVGVARRFESCFYV